MEDQAAHQDIVALAGTKRKAKHSAEELRAEEEGTKKPNDGALTPSTSYEASAEGTLTVLWNSNRIYPDCA
jgi:hypothetical protein